MKKGVDCSDDTRTSIDNLVFRYCRRCAGAAEAIPETYRAAESVSSGGRLAGASENYEWRTLGRSHPSACGREGPHLGVPPLLQHRTGGTSHVRRAGSGKSSDSGIRFIGQTA